MTNQKSKNGRQTVTNQYPGAVDLWIRNFQHVEQLFDYGSDVRKVMYTTDVVESINASFPKVKKGSFPNENAVCKLIYLWVRELEKKWDGGRFRNWAMVLNLLIANEEPASRLK